MTLIPINNGTALVTAGLASSELDTLRRTIGHDLDPNEFELFAAICRRTGLDPFARQIYAVKRWDGRQRKEVMQIQTGIDGLRLIAERSQQYAGQTPAEWCGPDGKWVDVWLSDEAPAAARVGVLRHDFREPVYGVAKFSSYCATTKEGKPMALWASMPEVMIAKCAEALAIRKAFPNDVSGVYTREEMGQQHNADGPPLATPEQVARIDELLPLVPQDSMPELKAWKAEAGISMKAGEFTAEMADRVVAQLEELTASQDDDHQPPAAGEGSSEGDPVPWKTTDEDAWARWNRRTQAKARGTKDKPGVLDPDDTIRDAQRHGLALQASRRRTTPVGSWSEVTETEAAAIEGGLDLLKNNKARMVQDQAGRWSCDRTQIEAGGAPTSPREPHGTEVPTASVPHPPDIVDADIIDDVPPVPGGETGRSGTAAADPADGSEAAAPSGTPDDTLDLLRQAVAQAPRMTEPRALKRAREIAQEMGLEKLPTDFESLPRFPDVVVALATELAEAAA